MSSEIVISVSYNIKWSEISDILEKKRFEYAPGIAYVIQRNGSEKGRPTLLYFNRPFSLWEFGVPIEILCKYARDEIERKEQLKVAREAYLRLRKFAHRCADRVLADLICAVLLKTWNSPADQFLYFIEGPPSAKILARLSYLYPSLEKLTICFLSFRPEDMMTSVMSFQTGRLEFDIHRLLSEETVDFQGPYPGTSEESLIQTYFYRHPEVRPGKKISPLRIDIFGQGLLESVLENKKETVKRKLEDERWTLPYSIDGYDMETVLPKGLANVMDSWKGIYGSKLDQTIRRVAVKETA